jgi:hypothetical protein
MKYEVSKPAEPNRIELSIESENSQEKEATQKKEVL